VFDNANLLANTVLVKFSSDQLMPSKNNRQIHINAFLTEYVELKFVFLFVM